MFYIIPYLEVINMTVRNEKKPYYLGLTLDDTSIGWALTDPAYNILRASRKDAWGTRLFSAAETAEKARAARMARRTLRRKHRKHRFSETSLRERDKQSRSSVLQKNGRKQTVSG